MNIDFAGIQAGRRPPATTYPADTPAHKNAITGRYARTFTEPHQLDHARRVGMPLIRTTRLISRSPSSQAKCRAGALHEARRAGCRRLAPAGARARPFAALAPGR